MIDQSEQKQIILFFFLILYGLTHITHIIHSFIHSMMVACLWVAWFTLLALDTIEIHSTESHLRALKIGASGAFKEANHKQTNKQTNETNNTSNDVVEETTIDKIPSSKTLPTQIPKYVTLHCCCCEQMDRSKSITIFQLRCCCCEQMDRSKSITSIFQTIFITMWWGGGNVQVQSPKSKPVRGGHPPARPPTLEPHQVGGSSPPRV
jgi:hypothetical protein